MKELEYKIADIIRKHEYWTMGAVIAAKEIAALIEPIQTRLDMQIVVNDKLLLKLKAQAKLIEAQDELITWFGAYGGLVPYVIDIKAKIIELKKDVEK